MLIPALLDLAMATEPKTLPLGDVRDSASSRVSRPELHRLPASYPARIINRNFLAAEESDVLLLHHGVHGPWAAKLAARIRAEHAEGRNFGVVRTACDTISADILLKIERCLHSGHCVVLVASKSMLEENRDSVKGILALLARARRASGRVIAILKDNVTMPVSLRLGEWIDFRNDREFETSFRTFLAALNRKSTPVREDSSHMCGVKERLLSNLFPVVDLPKFVYSAETRFQTDSEAAEACGEPGPLPFLLKGSRLYTTQPLAADSVFASALATGALSHQEDFSNWLLNSDRAGWAVELLNNLLRHHAWKRGLRFDEDQKIYYFSRSKPKNIWWQIGQQTIPREVTAPHLEWIPLENHAKAEAQFGWRHQGVRASFIQVLGTLFLRMEPTWLLTEIDGRTAMTTRPVGPAISDFQSEERNGQVLRSLRFWSSVLAKGHHELRMNTGQEPVRARLVPVSGFSAFGFRNDQMDYDRLVLTEKEDDLSLPELRPFELESAISYEEDLPSQLPGSPRGGQAETRI